MGLDWRRHRRRGVRRKVAERLRALGVGSLTAYLETLKNDPREQDRFAALLGVTISRFFRDAHVFHYLAEHVWPKWSGRHKVFMSSCGCAGGEEPYSLAVFWREKGPPDVRPVMLAMERDAQSLDRAMKGLYPPSSLKEVPPDVRDRHFRAESTNWRIRPEIREMVHFYRADLRRLGPPEGMDLILCRNLAFTYFTRPVREETARALAAALRPGGYLVVGATETVETVEWFEAVYPCIYRLKDESRP